MKLCRLSREQSRVSKLAPSCVISTGWGLRFMYSIKQQASLFVKQYVEDTDGIRTREAALVGTPLPRGFLWPLGYHILLIRNLLIVVS